ncbi:hypothetical protein VULLAG_LOCUS19273 [Vulpes lagopus]
MKWKSLSSGVLQPKKLVNFSRSQLCQQNVEGVVDQKTLRPFPGIAGCDLTHSHYAQVFLMLKTSLAISAYKLVSIVERQDCKNQYSVGESLYLLGDANNQLDGEVASYQFWNKQLKSEPLNFHPETSYSA